MAVRDYLKKSLISLACIATFLGPTIGVKQQKITSESSSTLTETVQTEQNKEYSVPTLVFKNNTAQARDYNLEGRMVVLGFDILINGLKSGIGAKCRGDDFWPAFGKGALSGTIVYTGKEIASHNRYPFLGATGKLVHDLGVSMSDNVMMSKPILSRYVTDFGPIEFHLEKGKETKLFFHPFSLAGIIKNVARGNQFDLKETMYNFTPVFAYNLSQEQKNKNFIVLGETQQNVFSYCRNCREDNLDLLAKSHEMNHVLFFSEFRFLDELIGNKSEVIKGTIILHPLAPLFDYIRIGPMLSQGLLSLPNLITDEAYYYSPQEIEAFTINRPQMDGLHPFYR